MKIELRSSCFLNIKERDVENWDKTIISLLLRFSSTRKVASAVGEK